MVFNRFIFEVAAAGCIVCAVEHTDGTASRTTLEGGEPLPFSPGQLSRDAQMWRDAGALTAEEAKRRGAAPKLEGGQRAVEVKKAWPFW